MKFLKTPLEGAYLIEIDRIEDERGFFSRAWDRQKFTEMKLNSNLKHCNISFSKKRATMHGLHYQRKSYAEEKLVRCTKGKIYDVIIDLRKNSKTYKNWYGVQLDEENHRMIYVPKKFAHGFVTLEDNSEVFYQNTQVFLSEYECGIRWDDPEFKISWPVKPKYISRKDSSWEFFDGRKL